MSRQNYTFTSESVSEGHPDKVCDRISDAVLDAFLAQEPEARVACETFATTNRVVIGGEVGLSDQDKLAEYMGRIDEIARVAGVGDQVAAITEKAMRGEIDFQVALRKRVALLKGFAVVKLQEIFDTRIELAPGAETMVRTMRSWGAKTALISGGFTFFSERVALLAGFHSHRANTLEEKDGLLTGNPIDPLLGPDAKLAAFNEGVAAKNTTADQALAIGDGANDLPMIKAAGLGVAYRAKPAVVKAADACLDFSDLTAVLHLQGVFSRDFIS